MNILIGYGYYPNTTGRYIEAQLADGHTVTFVGTPFDRPGYLPNFDLLNLIKQRDVQPDLFLYIDSGHVSYLPRNIESLECPTACYLIDVHLGSRLREPLSLLFDYVFIAQRDYVEDYQVGSGQHVEWLPLACDPLVHRPLNLARTLDVGFVGHVDPDEPRARLLEALGKKFTLNDYQRPYTREEMATIYNQSKIVFNYAVNGDVNMRVFEAMACGALLITNRIGNGLFDLFQDGKDMITYETEQELVERVSYYLTHEQEREEIAQRGQALVVAQHTYKLRAERILDVVLKWGPDARSPMRQASQAKRIALYADLYSKFRLLDASYEMVMQARRYKQARIVALAQFAATILRRIKYG